MLIGLYGGTFDPVHCGHVHAAECVRKFLGLDAIRLVLNAQPVHKSSEQAMTAHRWAMLKAVCANRQGLIADDVEVRRGGRSYTVDTLSLLRREFPQAVLCWIVGEDSFATLTSWRRWENLLDHCNLVVIPRPGQNIDLSEQIKALCRKYETAYFDATRNGQIVRASLPMRAVSSTEIRQRIALGQSVADLVEADVEQYIRRHKLYKDNISAREKTF
jgi:nicotinate-nucleotide adenylyltransferase